MSFLQNFHLQHFAHLTSPIPFNCIHLNFHDAHVIRCHYWFLWFNRSPFSALGVLILIITFWHFFAVLMMYNTGFISPSWIFFLYSNFIHSILVPSYSGSCQRLFVPLQRPSSRTSFLQLQLQLKVWFLFSHSLTAFDRLILMHTWPFELLSVQILMTSLCGSIYPISIGDRFLPSYHWPFSAFAFAIARLSIYFLQFLTIHWLAAFAFRWTLSSIYFGGSDWLD